MLKKELAKLIETLNDEDSIDEAISKSDLGKALASSGLTIDAFKDKIANDKDFKAYIDSEKDKHHGKALETWKSNNLSKLIDDEIKKRYPEQDPKDKALADMQAQIEKMQADSLKKDLTNRALKTLTDKGLPTDLANFVIGADEETTDKNLQTLLDIIGKRDEAVKTEFAKTSSYKPPKGAEAPTDEEQKELNDAKAIMEKTMGIKF